MECSDFVWIKDITPILSSHKKFSSQGQWNQCEV